MSNYTSMPSFPFPASVLSIISMTIELIGLTWQFAHADNGSHCNETTPINNNIIICYIAEFFTPTAGALIGYFEVTGHVTIKLYPAKSLWAGSRAKSMTSEGNSALLPANVDRRPPLLLLPLHVFLFVLYNKSLNDWSLGTQLILFPSNFNVSLGTSHLVAWELFAPGHGFLT